MSALAFPVLRARLTRLLTAFAVAASTVVTLGVATAPIAAAAPCDAPVLNKIACENTKPGTANWQVGSRDDSIVGYTTDISTTAGGRVDFKMLTNATSYRLDIFRLGYYGGVGARQLGTVSRNTAQNQPPCLRDGPTALIDCGNWAVSVSWTVPLDAVSGIYYARVTRNDNGLQNEIVFVVREDTSTSKILFQTSDSTWVAYNRFGGNSLYWGDGPGNGGSSFKVSYNRPYTGGDGDENFIFNAEYPMLRFLESNGYDMSYTTDVDSARRGHLIKNHKVFMAVGHDEYWSKEQRDNVEAARAAGVHLAFLTGNEVFWKTRWEKSMDASQTDWRTLVCYKETKATQVDPHPTVWTGTWRDPRQTPPKDAGYPENALLGNIFTVNGRRNDSLQVPAEFGKMRLWRNTPLSNMTAGTTYTFQPGTLGYEWNTVEDNGFQPPGVAQFSRTTVAMPEGPYVLQNWGDYYTPDTKTHAITYYRHASGSLVFGAGTVQWAWGVDDEHAFLTNTPTSDVRMKQATINFLADMGVQPTTLRPGLVAASPSSDTSAPTVAITNLPEQATVGQPYTLSGMVVDAGGQVAGVEVSTDGGATWHLATWNAGTTTWTYTYTPIASGTADLRARAVDDSLNLSTPVAAGPTVAARTCPCGVWTAAAVPKKDIVDAVALELGMKWRSNTAGYVRGVKFYKGSGNTGTHTGSLWTSTGQRLASGTFTNETASGWQTLTFPVPVAVNANTTYIVSYYNPTGRYSADQEYFYRNSAYLEPLRGLESGTDGPNGVFGFGAGFPDRTSLHSNYWVDVLWAPDPGPDTRAPVSTGTDPAAGTTSVALTPTVSASFDERIAPDSVQFTLNSPGGAVAGTSSVSADGFTVSFTPSAALAQNTTYTASLNAADMAGNALPTPLTWSFTTGAVRPATCPCTIWDDFAKPVLLNADDSSAIELGTKVRFDGKGEVLGVRFYKGSANTGTHKGSLWSADGLLLASGTFTGESAAGWQKLTFANPVTVQANTTYVVSYYAPNGRYSVSGGYFNYGGADYGPMHAPSTGSVQGNGVYRYGAGGGFPTASYNGSNYWVDVVYRNGLNGDTTPPSLTARTPAVDATGVALNATLTATFSEPVDPASAQIFLTDPGSAKLAGTVSLSTDQRTVTWTPNGALSPGTRYTASVGIADANGVTMGAPATWSFTTTSTANCPCTMFSAAVSPAVTSADDTGAYELGVRISPTASGKITGVKFYKGAGNTGTHTGSLWSASGQRLATGTFSGESASGWQTLTFASPVTVSAGVTYIASYTTTTGRYAVDPGYFQRTAVTGGPLTAPSADNGVYSVGSGFPTNSYQGGNYWVDAVYVPNDDNTPPGILGRTPLGGASDVSLTSTVTATFNEPVDLGSAQFTVSDPGGAGISGSLSLSGDQRTVTWTPSAPMASGISYTAAVRVADTSGNLMATSSAWNFTTTTTQTCLCSLFSSATVPSVTSADDTGAYELGVRFVPSANGTITGVKFYKGAGNTGTHTGSLWSADGTRLATGTFTGESATGWQTLTFSSPVAVTAGTAYVASYTTTTGRYAVNAGYFSGYGVAGAWLSAPATAAGAGNGVYAVGSGFPTSTYQGGNYWVDVVFATS